MKLTTEQLAKMMDQSKLEPFTTEGEIRDFCDTVKRYGFGAVYVLPCNFRIVRETIDSSDTILGTAIGFPFGTHTTETKLFESEQMLKLGAQSIDVVINIGALKAGDYTLVHDEMKALVALAGPHAVKSILEVSYLSDDEIARGTQICCDAGVAFVKTATGFGSRASSLHDVMIIREHISKNVRIKVAGGVRDIDTLLDMWKMGVSRFGVSKGDRLLNEFSEKYNGSFHTELFGVAS